VATSVEITPVERTATMEFLQNGSIHGISFYTRQQIRNISVETATCCPETSDCVKTSMGSSVPYMYLIDDRATVVTAREISFI